MFQKLLEFGVNPLLIDVVQVCGAGYIGFTFIRFLLSTPKLRPLAKVLAVNPYFGGKVVYLLKVLNGKTYPVIQGAIPGFKWLRITFRGGAAVSANPVFPWSTAKLDLVMNGKFRSLVKNEGELIYCVDDESTGVTKSITINKKTWVGGKRPTRGACGKLKLYYLFEKGGVFPFADVVKVSKERKDLEIYR